NHGSTDGAQHRLWACDIQHTNKSLELTAKSQEPKAKGQRPRADLLAADLSLSAYENSQTAPAVFVFLQPVHVGTEPEFHSRTGNEFALSHGTDGGQTDRPDRVGVRTPRREQCLGRRFSKLRVAPGHALPGRRWPADFQPASYSRRSNCRLRPRFGNRQG